MADEVDLTNDRIEYEMMCRLAALRVANRHGLDQCERCSDDIHPTRKALGARLCFTCQDGDERRQRHMLKG